MKIKLFFFVIIICLCLIACKRKTEKSEKKDEVNTIRLIDNSEQLSATSEIIHIKQIDNLTENEEKLSSATNISEIFNSEDQITHLPPLKENEFFQLRFIDYDKMTTANPTNIIEKIIDGSTEEYYNTGTGWGTCQLSRDKRKVLIKRNGNHDIYLLDGNTGMIKYSGRVSSVCCGSMNLDYLITSKWYQEENEKEIIGLCILNMETFEEEYNYFWENQDERITYLNILECTTDTISRLRNKLEKNNIEITLPDTEFDCLIYGLGDEGPTAYGFAFFNVNSEKFIVYNIIFET